MLAGLSGTQLDTGTAKNLRQAFGANTDTDPIAMLLGEVEAKSRILTLYNKFLTLTGADAINCQVVGQKAERLRGEIDELLNLSGLRTKIDAALAATNGRSTNNAFTPEKKATALLDLKILSTALKAMEDRKDAIQGLQALLTTTLTIESAFVEVITAPTLGGPTRSEIRVGRTNNREAGATEEAVATIVLDLGTAPLSVSIGIGASMIDDVKIVRQASSDGAGGVTNRFGYENNSTFKPSGVVLLNGHVFNTRQVTIGPSAGLVVSERGGSTQLEYVLGASLGFRDNLIWLTGGFHAARVDKIAGFAIGDPVPASLQDSLPIERSFQKGFMFAMTIKVR